MFTQDRSSMRRFFIDAWKRETAMAAAAHIVWGGADAMAVS
jgi:hypothetical protein